MSFIQFDSRILTLLCSLLLIVAFVWYVFSYIPFGQQCLANSCRTCCSSLTSA